MWDLRKVATGPPAHGKLQEISSTLRKTNNDNGLLKKVNGILPMNHFVLKDMIPRVPGPGVEMRVITGEKMTMVFFKLEPGSGVPIHAHPHEQIGTVLKGRIELVVDDERRIVVEGEAYHVPSNVLHGGKCGEVPSEIIEVFCPPREDLR